MKISVHCFLFPIDLKTNYTKANFILQRSVVKDCPIIHNSRFIYLFWPSPRIAMHDLHFKNLVYFILAC